MLSGLTETFSFHASPERFITSRVLAFRKSKPALIDSRTPIQAKILNRNVAVISSYDHVRQLLYDETIASHLSSRMAYDELMAPFFPPPNLLLLDPPDHSMLKEAWQERMKKLVGAIKPLIKGITEEHLRRISSGSNIDLYENMKSLSWRILLSVFVADSSDQALDKDDADKIESLQEDLLRGQFSLFPVSVNTRIWRSPRSKGLQARRDLESLLASKVVRGRCPFIVNDSNEGRDIANHLLLFTSSLAAKALASLLTALILNIYLFKGKDRHSSLSMEIRKIEDHAQRSDYINSVILETERVSPPVVGIMRRNTQEILLKDQLSRNKEQATPPTLIPKDWDLWIYFVGAARDPGVFGDTADSFVPLRYVNLSLQERSNQEGFAFGAGTKICLGRDLMRTVAMTLVETCLGLEIGAAENGVSAESLVIFAKDVATMPLGVQAWLGWQSNVKPEDWANDMKQLPTQRPRRPITVEISHRLESSLGHPPLA